MSKRCVSISTVSQAKSLLLTSSTANHGPVEDTDEESDSDLDDDPGTGVVCVRSGFPAWEKTSDGSKDLEETGVCETETAGESKGSLTHNLFQTWNLLHIGNRD